MSLRHLLIPFALAAFGSGSAGAQDPEPASPAPAPPFVPAPADSIAPGQQPGGVDFADAEAVRREAARLRELQSKLAPEEKERALLLERQITLLAQQNSLLGEQAAFAAELAQATPEALVLARAEADAARAALTDFREERVSARLGELARPEALGPVIAAEYEAPWAAARERYAAVETAFEAAAARLARLDEQLRAEQLAVQKAATDYATLRAAAHPPGAAEAALAPLKLTLAEQELVHHRMAAELLAASRDGRERLVALLANRQDRANLEEALLEQQLAAARLHVQARLAQATRDAEDEVRRRQRDLDETKDQLELPWKRARLDQSQLEAATRAEQERTEALSGRLEQASGELRLARDELQHYRAAYRLEAQPLDPHEVAAAIERLDTATSLARHFTERSELRAAVDAAEAELATAREERSTQVAALAGLRDEAERAFGQWVALQSPPPDAAGLRAAEALRWQELATERRALLDERVSRLERRILLGGQLLAVQGELYETRSDTLALLRSENLFLRGTSRITRLALESGQDDLARLPGWTATQVARLPGWLAEGSRRRSLLTFLAALLPLCLLLYLPHHWMTRRIARLGAMDLTSLPVRTALLLASLVRTACFAAFFWLAPLLAAAVIEGLPEGGGELCRGLGVLLALFWLGLGVSRDLLHPHPPARMVLAVDARTARRVGIGVTFLLWLSLGVLSLQQVLRQSGYANEGALEALDLAYKFVAGVVVMGLLLHRAVLLSLLPPEGRPIGRFLRRIAGLLQPVLVLLVPTLVVLDALQYSILAGFLTRLAVILLAAFPLGSILYQTACFFVERWRDGARKAVLERDGEEEDELALQRVTALDELARFTLRIAVILSVGWMVFAVTGSSFATIRTFMQKALPLQVNTPLEHRVSWWNVTLAVAIAFLVLRCAKHLRLLLADVLLPLTRFERSTQYTITTIVHYLVMGLGLWVAVNQVVDVRNLGYVVAALSVGIGFGLQEIISNFVSGVILLVERPLKPGDTVELSNGTTGTVRELGIRATTVQTGDNVHVLVPNREFITQKVVNYDLIDRKIRIAVDVGVAYGSDPKLVRETLLEVARNDKRIMRRPAPEVLFTSFGDSALAFRLHGWIESAGLNSRIASDLRFAIDAAFKRAAIDIPFPQREVTLRADRPLRVLLEAAPATAAPAPEA